MFDDIIQRFLNDSIDADFFAFVKDIINRIDFACYLYDAGKLSNHRVFWNVEQGSFDANERTRINSTITELIYVPNEIEDGEYLLNLQIAPFAADASPSRPILFRVPPLGG